MLNAEPSDWPVEFHCWGLVVLSGQQPPSEEVGGSGRASGLALLFQTAPDPLAPPAVTERPKPGLSAEAASGGLLEDSGEILAKPKEEQEQEEEEEDSSASVGMTIDAVEQPSEEAAEAGLWRQGLMSELMMH